MTHQDFYNNLAKLRHEIATLPQEVQQAMNDAAVKVEEQHERMRRACDSITDSVADISLAVESTKFEVAAIQTEAAQGFQRR